MKIKRTINILINKYTLIFLMGLFLFFSCTIFVFAVSNYGEGIYGDGLYSAETVVTPPSGGGGGGGSSSGSGSQTNITTPIMTNNPVLPVVIPTTIPTVPSICSTLVLNRTIKLTIPRMTGNDIKDLQNCLNSKLSISLILDGVFGSGAYQAVILFQKSNGLTPDGAVGPKTREYIKAGLTTPAVINTSPIPSTTTLLAPAFVITRTLKRGIKGEDVKYLQNYLNTHGYDCGIADGSFGLKTKQAIILLQIANGLTPDGSVGPKTKEKLK